MWYIFGGIFSVQFTKFKSGRRVEIDLLVPTMQIVTRPPDLSNIMKILFIRGAYPQTIPLTQYLGKHEVVYTNLDDLTLATIESTDIVVVIDRIESIPHDEVVRRISSYNPDLPIVSLLYKRASSSFAIKPLYTPPGCSLRNVFGAGEINAECGRDEEYELHQTLLEFNKSKEERDSSS